jgi:hypothetical protein
MEDDFAVRHLASTCFNYRHPDGCRVPEVLEDLVIGVQIGFILDRYHGYVRTYPFVEGRGFGCNEFVELADTYVGSRVHQVAVMRRLMRSSLSTLKKRIII